MSTNQPRCLNLERYQCPDDAVKGRLTVSTPSGTALALWLLSALLCTTAACGGTGSATGSTPTTPSAMSGSAGRFVTVGFWQDPACSGEPTNTTAFPVGYGDTQCFAWPGRSGENSASRFSCGEQSFSYTQWTTLVCSGGQVPEGTRKTVGTATCTQGVPPTQYARILDFSGCAR